MAEKRMFSKQIIDSDAFLDMPQTSQLLYFHLAMRADDDGFINNAKSIMRNAKCGDDDLKLLNAKKFIIPFETGIVVIKHWKIHNYIAKDRYKETKYKQEKSTLALDENSSYTLNENILYTDCIQNGNKMDTQVRLDKIRLEEISIDNNIPYSEIIDYLNLKANTKYKSSGKKTKDLIKARFNEKFTLEDFKIVIDKKCAEWMNQENEKYLRPETLFGNKFEGYLNQKGVNNVRGYNQQDTSEKQKYNFGCFE